jgi:hypothetical protein
VSGTPPDLRGDPRWEELGFAVREAQQDRGRDVGGPFAARDAFDRRVPTRLGLHHYLLVVARSDPDRVRPVPAAAVQDENTDDDGAFALVACPCEHKPVVRSRLEKCPGCERYYTLVGNGVFVVYGAMTPPSQRPEAAA